MGNGWQHHEQRPVQRRRTRQRVQPLPARQRLRRLRATLPHADAWPLSLRGLMERCWQHAPAQRPAFSAILDEVERIAEEAGVALS